MNFMEINKIGEQRFSALFQPLQIKKITIPNRIFFPPFGLNICNEDGTMSEELENFYLNIVKGGVGLVIIQNATVSPDSLQHKRNLRIYEKKHADILKRLTEKIKNIGGVPGIQLNHYGREGNTILTNKPVLAPSNIPSALSVQKDPNYKIKVMTLEDIENVKNQFVNAAELCVAAGFQFIQFHGAGGQLINQFLSSYTNKREDAYGGDINNRAKFLIEVIEGVRKRIGNDIILSIRLNMDELYDSPDCLKIEEYKHLIPTFEDIGIDFFMPYWMTYHTWRKMCLGNPDEKRKITLKYAKNFQALTGKPVGYVSYINNLKTAEEFAHQFDLIGIGRSLFVDNEMITKTLQNREYQILKCTNCFKCISDMKFDKIARVECINKSKRPI